MLEAEAHAESCKQTLGLGDARAAGEGAAVHQPGETESAFSVGGERPQGARSSPATAGSPWSRLLNLSVGKRRCAGIEGPLISFQRGVAYGGF